MALRGRTAIVNSSLAALAIVGGVIGYTKLGTDTASTPTGTAVTVKKANILSSVTASGNVEAINTRSLSFPQAGTVTEIDVKLGDKIAKGTVIAKIDDTAAKASLASAQAGLASAQAALAKLQSGLTTTERQQLTVSANQSQLSVDSAQASLDAANATADADTKQWNAAITQAQANLDNVKAKTTQDLSVAQAALDAANAKGDAAGITSATNGLANVKIQNTSSLNNAQNQLDSANNALTNGQTKDAQSVATAQRQLQNAKLSFSNTQLGNKLKLAPATDAQVTQAQAQVLTSQNQVATAQKTLDQTVLTASIDGTVTTLNGTVGEASSVSGSGASASASSSSSAFAVITDLANLRVTASFSETDAAKITLGMAATLTFDALSGKSVNGKVTYISATSTTSNNVISYPVQVTVDTPDPTIKPGMTATVAVTVDKRDGVLSLPSAAVSGRGTTGTVTIKGPKGNTQVRVQIGLRGDAGVEITSGLTEGQQVVVIPTTSGTSFNATRLGGAGGIGGIGGAVVGGGGPAGGLPRGG